MTYYFKWSNSLFDEIMLAIRHAARTTSDTRVADLYHHMGGYLSDVRNNLHRNLPEPYYPIMRDALVAGLWAASRIKEGEFDAVRLARSVLPDDHDMGVIHTTGSGTRIHLVGYSRSAHPDFTDRVALPPLGELGIGGALTAEESTNVVVTRDENLLIYQPTPELMETLPVGARNFAIQIRTVTDSSSNVLAMERSDRGVYSTNRTEAPSIASAPSGETLIAEARVTYREWLRLSMGRSLVNQDEIRKQREAREASQQRFSAFVRRTPDTERHVPTLPFVPHGLSSSRRWGIEVESGGARGVAAPEKWRRIGDGSLRSAWDGYTEVQDFEPFDEEVNEYIRYVECPEYGQRHIFEEYYYNNVTGRDGYRIREDYVDPASCEACGDITRTVHRVPETIRHTAQSDDCGEFVSPILVSMHSNGLKSLLDQLALQPQNKSAGVHVHVEADDLSSEQVATLIFGYDILEPILEASYQREARRYCQRREASDVLQTARKLRSKGQITQDEVRGGDRYVTLNTTALNQHGTIEFRAMGPVYDYDYLVRWAMLCRELVNVVAAGVTMKRFSKIRTWDDLTMLLAEYGSEYMRAVVYEQTGDTGHAADLVKRDQAVTTEALNMDWNAWAESLASTSSAFRGMRDSLAAVAQRLVTVGGPSSSGRNATWQV